MQTFLPFFGFKIYLADTSLFVYTDGHHVIYLIVYVNDLIIAGDKLDMITEFIAILAKEFSLKDLGHLSYFVGRKAICNSKGLVLLQRQYILDLLAKTKMLEAKSVPTPLSSNTQLTLGSRLCWIRLSIGQL